MVQNLGDMVTSAGKLSYYIYILKKRLVIIRAQLDQ